MASLQVLPQNVPTFVLFELRPECYVPAGWVAPGSPPIQMDHSMRGNKQIENRLRCCWECGSGLEPLPIHEVNVGMRRDRAKK